jgi:hypothetical protein
MDSFTDYLHAFPWLVLFGAGCILASILFLFVIYLGGRAFGAGLRRSLIYANWHRNPTHNRS